MKVFSANFEGRVSQESLSRRVSTKVFSAKSSIFTFSRKFYPSKVSRYTVSHPATNPDGRDGCIDGCRREEDGRHSEACHTVGVHFTPLAAETLGALSREAIDTVSSIGHIQGQRLGIPPAESIRHLFQRLAIALWRGNATLWIRRKPVRPAVVDGLI